MSKAILITDSYKDGSRDTVVWCPFWGKKPTKENASKNTTIVETEKHIEFIIPHE